ncbi:MAG: DUF3662 and FHA domain-containing protein [Sporomusaceae bacterium]|nr:DUF3662 and FHA domain-containing protein [Sporomusaceae bacterium]
MKFVRNLESFFEKYIEGYFNSKFSSELQPAEIAKKLVREMENKCSVGVSKTYAPNHYQVLLRKTDYEALLPVAGAIQEEMTRFLLEEAEKRDYTVLATPTFEFSEGTNLGKGQFAVIGEFTEAIPYERPAAPPKKTVLDAEELGQTKTFGNFSLKATETAVLQSKAHLKIVEGPDRGAVALLSLQRFHLGRRENNELSLSDMNTSRLHAYIQWEEEQYVLYDAKSLNGTYVNGQKISRKVLKHNDKIRVGQTLLLYEVI